MIQIFWCGDNKLNTSSNALKWIHINLDVDSGVGRKNPTFELWEQQDQILVTWLQSMLFGKHPLNMHGTRFMNVSPEELKHDNFLHSCHLFHLRINQCTTFLFFSRFKRCRWVGIPISPQRTQRTSFAWRSSSKLLIFVMEGKKNLTAPNCRSLQKFNKWYDR